MGAGPAGLSLASACAGVGMSVACVAPAPTAPWERSFAVWGREVEEMGCADVVEAEWAQPGVWLGEDAHRPLPFSYARLNVASWQQKLLEGCAAGSVALRTGSVMALAHDARATTATLASGETIRASVVVDATGPSSAFVERLRAKHHPAFQTAYGELCEVHGAVEMTLMDYRGEDDGAPPSFLYALPLPDGRVFLEETVLAARPPVPMSRLASRLTRRLERMGLRRKRVFDREHCVIPMGIALPAPGQRVVPFGAAASAVHPATGYQIARTTLLAPAVAAALAQAFSPKDAARRAYDVLWPRSRRAAWALYTFGMEAICGFDLPGLQSFLRAFFALPDASWLGFLRGTSSPTAIAVAMARVLATADPAVRSAILRLLLRQPRALPRPKMLEETV